MEQSVLCSVLGALLEMWKKIDETVCGEEIGYFLGTVIGLGQVNIQVAHEDGCVLGESLEGFFKVGEVSEGVRWKVSAD